MNLLSYLLACLIVNSLMRRRLIIVLEKTFLKLSCVVYDLVVPNDSSVLFCIILRTCHAFVRIFPLFEQKLLQCSLLAVAALLIDDQPRFTIKGHDYKIERASS